MLCHIIPSSHLYPFPFFYKQLFLAPSPDLNILFFFSCGFLISSSNPPYLYLLVLCSPPPPFLLQPSHSLCVRSLSRGSSCSGRCGVTPAVLADKPLSLPTCFPAAHQPNRDLRCHRYSLGGGGRLPPRRIRCDRLIACNSPSLRKGWRASKSPLKTNKQQLLRVSTELIHWVVKLLLVCLKWWNCLIYFSGVVFLNQGFVFFSTVLSRTSQLIDS